MEVCEQGDAVGWTAAWPKKCGLAAVWTSTTFRAQCSRFYPWEFFYVDWSPRVIWVVVKVSRSHTV